mmetsp:Transcript_42183/g.71717  ORF Transcript_42183/g.71717 Transcript_42183/m.71717 type:complete len:202 (+) Transcript_42183:1452-2057(+)
MSPRQIPAPPNTSMPSRMMRLPLSVHDCFMMLEITMGASWLSMMQFIKSAPATQIKDWLPMRANTSWIPPNSAMGTLNCLRTRQYAPTPVTKPFAAATEPAGRETPRPSARHSTNMCHPNPHFSWPPRMWSIGIQTSSPSTVPFMNADTKGTCLGPMRKPSCSRSRSATENPVLPTSPSSPLGSCKSNPTPTTPATGARVM